MDTCILFLGNPLHGDDGFGPAVYERIVAGAVGPLRARLAYVETAGLGALPYLEDCAEAVFVDAVHCDDPALIGRVAEFVPDTLLEEPPALSGHAHGLPFLLKAIPIAFVGRVPHLRILGAFSEPPRAFRMALSPLMERAVDEAAQWLGCHYGAHPTRIARLHA